jgi:glycosyltransferase involved in cell wall biosynthesis
MLITVAICTLNRAESLRRTLQSMAAMEVPEGREWEVVVVNNHCTDHTDDVIKTFADRLPIRREFEPLRGLSRARNCAVGAARGDYIVWTDDDVIVDPGWLAAYAEAFHCWPEAAVFGGKIVEIFATPVPKWLAGNEAFKGFAARDFGDEALPLSIHERRLPFGPNFAVRSAEQRAFRYNCKLGHAPGQQRRAEEVDVVERILQSGAQGYWVPRAQVEHCDTHEQQTLRYFKNFFATVGESEAFRSGTVVTGGPRWFGVPRWACRSLMELWLRYRIHRLVSPASVWLPHLMSYGIICGKIRYWWSERR